MVDCWSACVSCFIRSLRVWHVHCKALCNCVMSDWIGLLGTGPVRGVGCCCYGAADQLQQRACSLRPLDHQLRKQQDIQCSDCNASTDTSVWTVQGCQVHQSAENRQLKQARRCKLPNFRSRVGCPAHALPAFARLRCVQPFRTFSRLQPGSGDPAAQRAVCCSYYHQCVTTDLLYDFSAP
jgi:hypothetical protein